MDAAALQAATRNVLHAPDWSAVRTVCLDMDGTVLDLHFDNLFWLDALPRRWGAKHGIAAERAIPELHARFEEALTTVRTYAGAEHAMLIGGRDVRAARQFDAGGGARRHPPVVAGPPAALDLERLPVDCPDVTGDAARHTPSLAGVA